MHAAHTLVSSIAFESFDEQCTITRKEITYSLEVDAVIDPLGLDVVTAGVGRADAWAINDVVGDVSVPFTYLRQINITFYIVIYLMIGMDASLESTTAVNYT